MVQSGKCSQNCEIYSIFMLFAPLIKSVVTVRTQWNAMTQRKSGVRPMRPCRHSLNALARIWDVPPNKDAAQGAPYLSRASTSPRTISKRRSEDLSHGVLDICSNKARLSSKLRPSTDFSKTQIASASDQVLNAPTRAQEGVHGCTAQQQWFQETVCAERLEFTRLLLVCRRLKSFVLFLKKCAQMTSCISVLVIARALSDRAV